VTSRITQWGKASRWYIKLPAKVTLTYLPGGRPLARKLGVFNWGPMLTADYAIESFDTHFCRAVDPSKREGLTCLEVGPGESVSSAVVACARGAGRTLLVDVAPYASMELGDYQPIIEALSPPLDLASVVSVPELLRRCRAEYLTSGIDSLRALPAGCVDFIWSQAVLEHVRRSEMDELLVELRRVLKPDGVASHRIDLEDHFEHSLNNLRFSDRVWESDWMAKAGFYTNRLGYEQLLRKFEAAGFAVEVVRVDRWESLPIPRSRMDPQFRDLPLDNLLVSGFDVILRPV
jgi:SAM-dependent methyltransferase